MIGNDRLENDFQEQGRQVVQQALASRGWGLVQDEENFVQQVLIEVGTRFAAAQPRPLEVILEQATVKCYGHIWYAACQATGTTRQQRAFEELHRFLYRIAFNRVDGNEYLAQECAQLALVRTWQNLEQVEDPGSFMWWTLRVVNNVVNRQFTTGKRKAIDPETGKVTWIQIEVTVSDSHETEETVDAKDILENATTLARPDGLSFEREPTMTDEIRLELEAAIRTCLENERHQAVIIKTFLDEKGRQEVAAELNTTPEIVSVFKQRGLKYLKECEDFLAALEELL